MVGRTFFLTKKWTFYIGGETRFSTSSVDQTWEVHVKELNSFPISHFAKTEF